MSRDRMSEHRIPARIYHVDISIKMLKYLNHGTKLMAKDSWKTLVLNRDFKSAMGEKKDFWCTKQNGKGNRMLIAKIPEGTIFQHCPWTKRIRINQNVLKITDMWTSPPNLLSWNLWKQVKSVLASTSDYFQAWQIFLTPEIREHGQVTGILT